MNSEEMSKFIDNYEKIKSVRNEIAELEKRKQQLYAQKEQLEQDSRVRRYLLQLDNIDKVQVNIDALKNEHPDWNWNEEQIIEYHAFNREVNKYYVCIGGYKGQLMSCEPDYDHIFPANHIEVSYKIYVSLESGSKEIKKLNECDQFEKINKVIYIDDIYTFDFSKFKNNFFKENIKNADRECIQKVLSMRKDD